MPRYTLSPNLYAQIRQYLRHIDFSYEPTYVGFKFTDLLIQIKLPKEGNAN